MRENSPLAAPAVLLLVLLTALACERDEEKGRPLPPRPTPGGEPVLAARPLEAPPSCDDAPKWTTLAAACAQGSSLYAMGRIRTLGNRGMSWHAVSNRARAELTTENGVVQDSEVLDVFSCNDEMFALARAPLGERTVTRCEFDPTEHWSPTLEGCPDWVREIARVEGKKIRGLGVVSGMSDEAMARKTAANRALSEIQKSIALRVTRDGKGGFQTTSVSMKGSVKTGEDFASCQDLVFARVTNELVDLESMAPPAAGSKQPR